jgi:hypothetical protein
MPQMPSAPQPATFPRYDNSYQPRQSYPTPNVNGQTQMGATADDILRQANRNNPYYGAGSDPASIQRANEAWIHNQMMNDPAYNPALRNGVRNNFPINKQQELFGLLQDIVNMDNRRMQDRGTVQEDFKSPAFAAKTKTYTDALNSLQGMLSGKQKLSLAQAYYTMEAAYGESYLTAQEFSSIIQESAGFIREWMRQNNLNPKNNADINYAVQQFMGKHLSITVPKQVQDNAASFGMISHDAFFYDFIDYQGDKDHRNYFLTKCLATGSGQCNSMPAVYLVLVEALGGTAYLTVAPNHSFIKYPDKSGKLRNFEPTSNWDITDQWYQEHSFISQEAVKSGIYLSSLNKKQIVADIALQLAFGYFRKFGAADEKFIRQCITTANTQFPKNNNILSYFSYSNMYGYQLAQVMRRENITRLPDIAKSPEAQALYQKWLDNEKQIARLGYQAQPDNMYDEMLKEQEFKGHIQQQRNINGKQKRNLFIRSN